MPAILCYGDSNTHGAHPLTGGRYPREVRWTGVVARDLAGVADVIEEGLNGRTTNLDDPFVDGRNGRTYLLPCLRSHQPIDVVVIMLGTNDLKSVYHLAAHEIATGAQALVDVVLASGAGPDGGRPQVLLVAPPALAAATDRFELWGFRDSEPIARELPRLYRAAAEQRGVAFLDAGALVAGDPADGVHLSAGGHETLGHALAETLRSMLAAVPA
jgi:lysophospholipase L1-like esterase